MFKLFLVFLLFPLVHPQPPPRQQSCSTPRKFYPRNDDGTLADLQGGEVFLHSGGWASQLIVNILLKTLFEEQWNVKVNLYPEVSNEKLSNLTDYNWYWSQHETSPDYWKDYMTWMEEGRISTFGFWNSWHFPEDEDVTRKNERVAHRMQLVEEMGWYIPERLNSLSDSAFSADSDGANEYCERNDYRALIYDEDFRTATKLPVKLICDDDNHNLSFDILDTTGTQCIYQLCELGTEGCAMSEKGLVHTGNPNLYVAKIAKAQAEYNGLNNTYDFIYHGEEWDLLEFAKTAETNDWSYIIVNWQPSLLTSTIDFVQIDFQYNPTGLFDDKCLEEGSCGFVSDDISSIVDIQGTNSYEKREVPNLVNQFLSKVDLTRLDVDAIMDMQYNKNRNILGSVCDWVRQNEDIWSPWFTDLDSVEYYTYRFRTGSQIAIYSVSAILIAFLIPGLYVVWWVDKTGHPIKAVIVPELTYIWVFALILLSATPLILVQTITDEKCVALLAMANIGFTYVLCIPALKAWRLAMVFGDDLNFNPTSNDILKRLHVAVFSEIILAACYSYFMLTEGVVRYEYSSSDISDGKCGDLCWEEEYTCRPDNLAAEGFLMILGFLKIVYTGSLVYYAVKTKNVWTKYNETKFLLVFSGVSCVIMVFNAYIGMADSINFFDWRAFSIGQMWVYVACSYFGFFGLLYYKHLKISRSNNPDEDDLQEQIRNIINQTRQLNSKGRKKLAEKLLEERTKETSLRQRAGSGHNKPTKQASFLMPLDSIQEGQTEMTNIRAARDQLAEEEDAELGGDMATSDDEEGVGKSRFPTGNNLRNNSD